MRHRGWITILGSAGVLGAPLLSCAGLKELPHRGGSQNQAQIAECVRQKALMAYFHDDGGALAPVRDTQNTDRDKDWINLRFTDYDGPRIRLGVLKVINKSPESEDQGGGRIVVPVSGIVEMLTVSLYDTKRFDVIEEKRIQEVEREQKRKDVQEPSPNSIMNVGKVLGAQYLVYGTVNEWDPNRGGRHMGSGSALNGVTSKLFHGGINRMLGGSSGSIGGTKQEAEVAVTFSLTDVANGQILFTTSERARLGEWSVNWGAPGGESTGKVEKTPVNYAFRACANKAAFKIATFLRTRKWKGSVVQIKGADIFVNAGSQQGMAPDSLLAVQAVRGLITDPENHTILGEDLHGIGTLKVIAVQPGFSIARKKEGCKGLKKGDRVELATDPVPPQRIPACDALDTSASV